MSNENLGKPGEEYANWKAPVTGGNSEQKADRLVGGLVGVKTNPDGSKDYSKSAVYLGSPDQKQPTDKKLVGVQRNADGTLDYSKSAVMLDSNDKGSPSDVQENPLPTPSVENRDLQNWQNLKRAITDNEVKLAEIDQLIAEGKTAYRIDKGRVEQVLRSYREQLVPQSLRDELASAQKSKDYFENYLSQIEKGIADDPKVGSGHQYYTEMHRDNILNNAREQAANTAARFNQISQEISRRLNA
jgi:hypothetical protein